MSKTKKVGQMIRLDEELHKRAKEQAERDRRSLNAWINIAVEEKLERDQREAA